MLLFLLYCCCCCLDIVTFNNFHLDLSGSWNPLLDRTCLYHCEEEQRRWEGWRWGFFSTRRPCVLVFLFSFGSVLVTAGVKYFCMITHTLVLPKIPDFSVVCLILEKKKKKCESLQSLFLAFLVILSDFVFSTCRNVCGLASTCGCNFVSLFMLPLHFKSQLLQKVVIFLRPFIVAF